MYIKICRSKKQLAELHLFNIAKYGQLIMLLHLDVSGNVDIAFDWRPVSCQFETDYGPQQTKPDRLR